MNEVTVELDEESVVEQAKASIGERLANAAEYHTRIVYEEAPKRTLEMAKSIRYYIKPDNSGYIVSVEPFYSAFQEFGTKKMRANPFLLRGTLKALPGIIDIIEGNNNG